MRNRVTVAYYAALREQRGCSEEQLDLAVSTAAELYDELRARHDFTFAPEQLRVAVNDAYAPWETVLKPGDTVVFIPPVAGG